MRMFRVNESGGFTEYLESGFGGEYMEQTLEDWLESNPHAIIEDGKLMLIGRQVPTNLNRVIDLLALDREGNVVVVELKRDRTPRETLAQALEYAAFAANLNYETLDQIFQEFGGFRGRSLSEHHRTVFGLEENEGVTLNKDQRIAIVGGDITPSIQQTAKFLRQKGLRVTCVEFNFFRTDSGEQLLTTDVVVGREAVGGTIVREPRADRIKFLQSCDEAGRTVLQTILKLSEHEIMPVRWGTKGFSLNVGLNGRYVNLCYCYPPESGNGQSLYTAFAEIVKKAGGTPELVNDYRQKLGRTELFTTAGNEMKYVIREMPSNEQLEELIELIRGLAKSVRERALVDSSQSDTE